MRSRPWARVLSVAAGCCLAFGSTAAVLAQEQQTPPMTISSVNVENNLVRIVGLDQNGNQTVNVLELARLGPAQREALGLPPCGTVAGDACPSEANAYPSGGANSATDPNPIPGAGAGPARGTGAGGSTAATTANANGGTGAGPTGAANAAAVPSLGAGSAGASGTTANAG